MAESTPPPPNSGPDAPWRGLGRAVLGRVLDEPLVHFLLIGALVFALDQALSPRTADPRLIVLDDAAYGEIVDIYAASHGRPPTPEEMDPLAERWVMNETLYREAMALGLDRGDEMVKERIMQKMRVLLTSSITVDPPTEAVARDWFAQNRALYDEPARLSLSIAQIDGEEPDARRWADELNASGSAEPEPGPGVPPIIRLVDRGAPTLEQGLGPDFVAAVLAMPIGVWMPMPSPVGWQAVRLDARVPPAPARFEDVRTAAAADWREFTFRRAQLQSVATLQEGYTLERRPYDPGTFAARAEAVARAAEVNQLNRK